MAPALALAAMFCGREKIPPPIIEPITSATSALSFSCFEVVAITLSPAKTVRSGTIECPCDAVMTGVKKVWM